MFEERKAKKKAKRNEEEAIRIFTEMFLELNENNLYGVTEFTPLSRTIPVKDVNDDINYHMYKMAEECGVFLIIDHEYKEDVELYKYTLSMEPIIIESNNILSLDAYRKIRTKGDKGNV